MYSGLAPTAMNPLFIIVEWPPFFYVARDIFPFRTGCTIESERSERAHTELAEVEGGPVESKRTGWRQCTNTDSAMNVQPPQSIATGRQMSEFHLST